MPIESSPSDLAGAPAGVVVSLNMSKLGTGRSLRAGDLGQNSHGIRVIQVAGLGSISGGPQGFDDARRSSYRDETCRTGLAGARSLT
jgi:hypothetical protein